MSRESFWGRSEPFIVLRGGMLVQTSNLEIRGFFLQLVHDIPRFVQCFYLVINPTISFSSINSYTSQPKSRALANFSPPFLLHQLAVLALIIIILSQFSFIEGKVFGGQNWGYNVVSMRQTGKRGCKVCGSSIFICTSCVYIDVWQNLTFFKRLFIKSNSNIKRTGVN